VERYIYSDLAWLAVDAVGHLAVFTTAGVAPIPSRVLDHRELAERAEELLEQLPAVGDCQMLVSLPRPDDYIGFARRGFFAYDWEDVHRTEGHTRCYEILARPTVPRSAVDITGDLRVAAVLGRLGALAFATSLAIPVGRLGPCEVGGR
jgi:hypothetical protein